MYSIFVILSTKSSQPPSPVFAPGPIRPGSGRGARKKEGSADWASQPSGSLTFRNGMGDPFSMERGLNRAGSRRGEALGLDPLRKRNHRLIRPSEPALRSGPLLPLRNWGTRKFVAPGECPADPSLAILPLLSTEAGREDPFLQGEPQVIAFSQGRPVLFQRLRWNVSLERSFQGFDAHHLGQGRKNAQ